MPELNTMFNKISNMACKNILFNKREMKNMHDSMVRLYAYVKDHKSLTGQTELAKAMSVTPQRVNNWESRGISEHGATTAQKKFGCDANWLLGRATNQVKQTFNADRAWPFELVDRERYEALPLAMRFKAQVRMQDEIEALEQALKANGTYS